MPSWPRTPTHTRAERKKSIEIHKVKTKKTTYYIQFRTGNLPHAFFFEKKSALTTALPSSFPLHTHNHTLIILFTPTPTLLTGTITRRTIREPIQPLIIEIEFPCAGRRGSEFGRWFQARCGPLFSVCVCVWLMKWGFPSVFQNALFFSAEGLRA